MTSPEGPVGPVLVIEVLELPQHMQEVTLIPDERAIQQLVTARLHSSFHDRIHPRHLDPAEHDFDLRVLKYCVEKAGELKTKWTSYMLARTWLAMRHRLPWPLMDFLADAHQRGVLRQAGAVYQFCHLELQRRLATRP